MKKYSLIRPMLVLTLILSMVVFMCACGGKKDSKKDEGSKEKAQAEETVEEKTLEQYFKDNPDDLQEIKDTVNNDESMKQALEYLDFDVYAEGNTLHYDYKFKETYSDDQVAQMKEKIPETLDEMGEGIGNTIGTIEKGFGVNDVTIHICYMNGDGAVIGERDYTK